MTVHTFPVLLLVFLCAVMLLAPDVVRSQTADQPYLGQIFAVAFDFVPRGFAECNGQLLPINQNQALFSLLGTTYGGNGITNFALPDLRGRMPVHASTEIQLGQVGGEETHTLLIAELPAHSHLRPVNGDSSTTSIANGNFPGRDAGGGMRYSTSSNAVLSNRGVEAVGGGQPHENRMPYLAIHYIIALQGIFPSRN